MSRCRRVRGLIAAAVYEEPSPRERELLRSHLASCSACRAEAEILVKTAALIPNCAPELPWDLLPAIRRCLAERRAPAWQRPLRWAMVAAACTVLLAAVVYEPVVSRLAKHSKSSTMANSSNLQPQVSPLETALNESAQLIENKEFTKAFQLLAGAVDRHPTDPKAGEAQKRVADVAFDGLAWYPQAYAAYEKLAQKYPNTLRTSPEAVWRRYLLAETRDSDFEALYTIEAAARGEHDVFANLEQIVCAHPGTFVASHAAGKMAALVVQEAEAPEGENKHLYAMAQARERCSQPVAVVQLTLEMGLICWEEMSDAARARDLFNQAVNDQHTVLAQRQLAQDSLVRIPQP